MRYDVRRQSGLRKSYDKHAKIIFRDATRSEWRMSFLEKAIICPQINAHIVGLDDLGKSAYLYRIYPSKRNSTTLLTMTLT